jgi:hypothetical protein
LFVIRDTRYEIRDTGCGMRDTGETGRDAGCGICPSADMLNTQRPKNLRTVHCLPLTVHFLPGHGVVPRSGLGAGPLPPRHFHSHSHFFLSVTSVISCSNQPQLSVSIRAHPRLYFLRIPLSGIAACRLRVLCAFWVLCGSLSSRPHAVQSSTVQGIRKKRSRVPLQDIRTVHGSLLTFPSLSRRSEAKTDPSPVDI